MEIPDGTLLKRRGPHPETGAPAETRSFGGQWTGGLPEGPVGVQEFNESSDSMSETTVEGGVGDFAGLGFEEPQASRMP